MEQARAMPGCSRRLAPAPAPGFERPEFLGDGGILTGLMGNLAVQCSRGGIGSRIAHRPEQRARRFSEVLLLLRTITSWYAVMGLKRTWKQV